MLAFDALGMRSGLDRAFSADELMRENSWGFAPGYR
jgi:hypothetical protein